MAKKMLIDATHAEETRVVVVDGNKVEEFDFESENKRQLAGNIYLAKVTRVEPSLQAAFVDYGGNRHGFLAFSEIHPDYYQIPVADREALMEEERAYAEQQRQKDEADDRKRSSRKSSSRQSTKADPVVTQEVDEAGISGMETIEFEPDAQADDVVTDAAGDEGTSPMERVAETPVEEPAEAPADDEAVEASQDDDTDEVDASEKDDSIESVGDDDDAEDIRPVRKPRPRRYKIQEVVKVRQIMLVQVVKEERGNKGAALTTYLSLAGRYCVLMPNTERGGGISRKITNAVDRKKLKEIAEEIDVPRGAGLIVRTAGAQRTKTEIKRDYEYLLRLWEQIRELTLESIAPAKIYEEGDLIKRSIRDLYSREIDEVLVEGDRGYRIAKDFMKMIMPSHAVNVKQYRDTMPLFARYQVESYLSSMFNPTVQLKSGGYIVIGVTEALVAIDVNSGRATKEGSIEETALKTNLEAAEEVARQLRLRDLAGLIVIDFIDMDERRNNTAVEKRIKDKLKTDRARIQVGRISGFGLLEMSRQRLRPGMIEATTQPCAHCHGTGLVRSDDNLALSILRQIEEEGVRRRSREVLVKCPVAISNYLMNHKREHVAQIEARYGLSVRIEADPVLISPDFSMEKFKTATRVVSEASHISSVDSTIMDEIDEAAATVHEVEEEEDAVVAEAAPTQTNAGAEGEEAKPKKRRRRRRRKSSKSGDVQENGNSDDAQDEGSDDGEEGGVADAAPFQEPVAEAVAADAPAVQAEEAPKRKVTRSRSSSKAKTATSKPKAGEEAEAVPAVAPEQVAEETPKPKTTRSRAKPKPKAVAESVADASGAETIAADAPEEKAAPKPKTTRSRAKPKPKAADAAVPAEAMVAVAEASTPVAEPVVAAPAPMPTAAVAPTPVAVAAPEPVVQVAPKAEAEAIEDDKPKRRGWWSLGR